MIFKFIFQNWKIGQNYNLPFQKHIKKLINALNAMKVFASMQRHEDANQMIKF